MDANKIIEALGGTGETARLCEVSPSAVSQWRENGIPRPWLKFLQAARPEIFSGAQTPAESIAEAPDLPKVA